MGCYKKFRVFLTDDAEVQLFKTALKMGRLSEETENIAVEHRAKGESCKCVEITLLNKEGIDNLNTAFYLKGPLHFWKGALIEMKDDRSCAQGDGAMADCRELR